MLEYPMKSGTLESQRRGNLADSDPYVKLHITTLASSPFAGILEEKRSSFSGFFSE